MSQPDGGWSAKLSTMEPTAAQVAALEEIRSELASLGFCLPGTLVVRTGRCGKVSCSCRNDPPRLHGPFRSWTRKVGRKTVTRLLSEEQCVEYQELFDNHRRLKELVRELEEISLALVDGDPRWPARPAPVDKARVTAP